MMQNWFLPLATLHFRRVEPEYYPAKIRATGASRRNNCPPAPSVGIRYAREWSHFHVRKTPMEAPNMTAVASQPATLR